MSDSELPRLAEALLGDEPLGELLASDALRTSVAHALPEIRSGSPRVVWWGRNVDRVDLTVRADADEWRVVYFTSDEHRMDDLSIFRRPPAFGGVSGGCAVIVNGPSGSGKSSVLEQIAAPRRSSAPASRRLSGARPNGLTVRWPQPRVLRGSRSWRSQNKRVVE